MVPMCITTGNMKMRNLGSIVQGRMDRRSSGTLEATVFALFLVAAVKFYLCTNTISHSRSSDTVVAFVSSRGAMKQTFSA